MGENERICRICLETKTKTTSIYDNANNNKYLPSIIEDISGVVITALNEPFAKICGSCSGAILQAKTTIQKCRNSDKVLKEQREQHQVKSEYKEVEEITNEPAEKQEDLKKQRDLDAVEVDATDAEIENVTESEMKSENKKICKVRKRKHVTEFSGSQRYTRSRLNNKTTANIKETSEEESSTEVEDNQTKTKCRRTSSPTVKSCQRRKRKLNTRKYVRTVNVNKDYFFSCSQCDFSTFFATYYREHLQLQHHIAQPRIFKCDQCERDFLEYRYLQQHIAYVHEKQPRRKKFLCSECGKGFDKSNHLQYHQRSHLPKDQRPPASLVKCEHCSKEFSKLSIRMHVKNVHSAERPFACTLCKSSFPLAKGLQAHMKICHPAELFICPCCEVKFRVRSVYETHVQRGTCQKLGFNCDYCAWGFKSQDRLEKHKLQVHKELIQQLGRCGREKCGGGDNDTT